jgi:hypothetical protein
MKRLLILSPVYIIGVVLGVIFHFASLARQLVLE